MTTKILEYQEAFAELTECAEIIEQLSKVDCLCEISFGRRDSEGGYGWFTTMQVSVIKVGEKCRKKGCWYDTTIPYKLLREREYQADLLGRTHRHYYGHAEKLLGVWRSDAAEENLKTFLLSILNQRRDGTL